MTFKFNEVRPYGYAADELAAEDECAIIFVGQNYLSLSGEGTDRTSLEMGAGQVESALNVAHAYKNAGKSTIVVVSAQYPVAMDALQNSEYVDAIIFAAYGLSHTTFEYSNLSVPESADADSTFEVSVTVTNTGDVTTSEVVQLYMSKLGSEYGSAAPLKKLVPFEKVEIPAGESRVVTLAVNPQDIALWDVNAEKFAVENGQYLVYAASSSDFSLGNCLSAGMSIDGEVLAALELDNASNVWEHSFNANGVLYEEYSKLQTAASAVADGVNDDTFAVASKQAGAWVAIPKIDFTNVSSVTMTAGAPDGVSGTVELRLDSPGGTKIGEFHVDATGAVTKTLVASNPEATKTITELDYRDLNVNVAAEGTHDLYLVFTAHDLRVGTIAMNTDTDRLYVVVRGDSLWRIASRMLGSGSHWNVIFDANTDIVKIRI